VRPLDLRAATLGLEPALLGGAGGTGGEARLGHGQAGADELGQPLARVVAVALLGAEALRVDHQHAGIGEPAVAARQQACAQRLGQRGEVATSKRSSTAEDTLLTFCPPAPLARTNRSTSSSSGMASVAVTTSGGLGMATL
jgi:hypothetical protein